MVELAYRPIDAVRPTFVPVVIVLTKPEAVALISHYAIADPVDARAVLKIQAALLEATA